MDSNKSNPILSEATISELMEELSSRGLSSVIAVDALVDGGGGAYYPFMQFGCKSTASLFGLYDIISRRIDDMIENDFDGRYR